MRTGRACVAFLRVNFDALDLVEGWMYGPALPDIRQDPQVYPRRDIVFYRRMIGLRRAGRLSVAAGFELLAWHRRVSLVPGFLSEEHSCSPERDKAPA